MITKSDLSAEALGDFLAKEMNRRCGASHPRLTELVPFAAQLALECIANSDALYHDVEHTMLVTLAGHDIFVGRALLTPSAPDDYAHLIVACLMHDIGYVRGILKGDGIDGYVIDPAGRKVSLPRGSSDAALMPYHVDRSKMFVLGRIQELDADESPRRSNIRDSLSPPRRLTTRLEKRACCCEQPISLANSETRIICESRMLYFMSLRKSG